MVNKSKSKKVAPFSIDLSKKECPPNELYGKYTGLVYKKRICVDPNMITILSQSRVVEIDPDHASKIAKSIKVKGWDHRQAPLVVTRDSRYPNEEKYELLAGHHRHKALTKHCNWPVIPIDIVQFENNKSKREFLLRENYTHDLPKKPPNKQDTAKEIEKMVREEHIGKKKSATNKEIRNYLEQTDLPTYGVNIEAIIKEVRKTLPYDGNMVVYNKDSATEKAKELGIAFLGSKNMAISNEFGYVQSNGKMHGNVVKCLQYYIETGEQTVVYMYIKQDPNNNKSLTPKTIGKQRKKMLKDFNDFCGSMNYMVPLYIQAYTDIDVNSVKITKTPIRFGGFLPQDHTKDWNGNYKETGLVDENGAPM